MHNYDSDIKKATEVLRGGGIILYPTDTIWGIGCDATCSEAVKRVFQIKQRSDSKALITLVDSIAALERIVDDVPDAAYQLIDVSDKPLTIVYDHGRGLAPEVTAQDGSVAIRITREEFSSKLCKAFRRPLISTSANISGSPSPSCFDDISDDIIGKVDYVCLSRRDERLRLSPSMVIKISSGGVFKLLRK